MVQQIVVLYNTNIDINNMSIRKSIAILLSIIIPSAIALIIIIPLLLKDIPNWVTLIVEIAIGFVIAISLFIFQAKTSNDLKDLVNTIKQTTEEIGKLNKEQEKQLKSVRFHSLLKIQTNLSSLEYYLRDHLRHLKSLREDLPSQERYVADLLHPTGSWSPLIVYKSEELTANLQVIRAHIPPMLYDSIDSINKGIQILYGMSPNFPDDDPVNNWRIRCNSVIERIAKIRKDISGILTAEKHLFDEIYKE
jgi:hypothetical protein